MGRHDRRRAEADARGDLRQHHRQRRGVNRLEPSEDWRHYIVAAIPKPVTVLRAPTERKTGVKHAEVITAWLVQDERGWLRLAG